MSDRGLRVVDQLPSSGVHLVSVPSGQERAVAALLSQNPLVEFAELDYVAHATIIPNDPFYDSEQWGLPKIRAPEAWDTVTGGSEIIIAIVDTGVDLSHPDLDDKIQSPGRDFVNDDYVAQDDHGHGTHVAGIAAAETNNGLGVAGVSWGARILPIKVLDAKGDGYYSNVARGVRYACNHGAKIINLSLGGANPSQTLHDALQAVTQKGCLVTAAAGNGYGDGVDYPAKYAETIAVAATNQSDQQASFSDYGSEVDVAAPGVSIYSSLWTASSHTYGYKDGTSMSTAFVSGLAALAWSFCPELSADQVRGIIEGTAEDLGAPGWDPYFGHGRIDAAAALEEAGPPPVLAVDKDHLVFLADATYGPWPQTVQVSNAALCRWLDWSAAGSEAWLDADPLSGQASYVSPADITVLVDKSGLAQGQTHEAMLSINSATMGVLESPQEVAVQFVYSSTSLRRVFYPLAMRQ